MKFWRIGVMLKMWSHASISTSDISILVDIVMFSVYSITVTENRLTMSDRFG